jgi:tRNA nucleotidyltransferase (CCA-adding enzyme)
LQIYLVGGAVRDHLLGLPVRERDWVVVGSTPELMMSLGYRPVGKDFPVFLHPQTHEEYALARTERKTGRGYTQFSFYSAPDVTLEEDLKRRDLTINAIAQSSDGKLIDPYGGQTDINNKVLRHVSETFIEDPVRILRVARFYARYAKLGFTIAPETVKLMQQMVANGEVDFLVAERVWKELEKALPEPAPQRFFEALRACGALRVIFPELDNLYGVPNPPKWHPEIDTGIHTMQVLEQAALLSPDPVTRFAALLHDLGKAVTPPNLWPQHPGHEEAGAPLVQKLCERLRIPKNYRELALITTRYHGNVHKAFELRAGTILKVLEKTDAFRRPERFQQFLIACEADARGCLGFETTDYPQRQLFLTALAAANEVVITELLEKGYKGTEFAEQLRHQRILKIKERLNDPGF